MWCLLDADDTNVNMHINNGTNIKDLLPAIILPLQNSFLWVFLLSRNTLRQQHKFLDRWFSIAFHFNFEHYLVQLCLHIASRHIPSHNASNLLISAYLNTQQLYKYYKSLPTLCCCRCLEGITPLTLLLKYANDVSKTGQFGDMIEAQRIRCPFSFC